MTESTDTAIENQSTGSSGLLSHVDKIEWLEQPVSVCGKVQRGFGRGSKQLGTPTANLPGHLVEGRIGTERDGVYLGYGIVPSLIQKPVKMVANLGHNITYGDVKERVLEAYLMDDSLADEFYGAEMRLCIGGFMRPEVKFNSIDELITNIRNDIEVSSTALDLPEARRLALDPSLISPPFESN